tara:strand:+ start:362 stop:970 length:609 start_codon:yes stop_codon:yes gene_type:complete
MEYNTERTTLKIPEYGRNVQRMVDYCLTIEDKEHRSKVAQSIIDVIGNLNPAIRDAPDYAHKLWDHLFIMSDFELDVDSPYPIPTAESFVGLPDEVPYPVKSRKFRHYGSIVKTMVERAVSMEDGEEKEALVYGIAYAMKRNYLKFNKDTVDDKTILADLQELAEEKLKLDGIELPHPKAFNISAAERNRLGKKKKKKKRRF